MRFCGYTTTMMVDDRLHSLRRILGSREPLRIPRAATPLEAAVALVLRAAPEPELLLIRRAVLAGDPWSGHIAFPGGRRHATDPDLLTTALRETEEETGIRLSNGGHVLGPLDEVEPRTHRLPPLVIAPWVVLAAADAQLRPDPREVEAATWVPVAELLRPDAVASVHIDLGDESLPFPCYRYGDMTIWGLTERILRQFLAAWRRAARG
jgi:8-oxo-dGTP pyrophosphatase MutT (NUDIX family)